MYVCTTYQVHHVALYYYKYHYSDTAGCLFVKGARKGVHRNYFHETTLAELLHAMEFLLIFDETNFIEVPKIL